MEYKIITENWKKFINEQQPVPPAPVVNPNAPTAQISQIRTYGDLQKIIAQINRNKSTKAIAGQAGNFVLDQIAVSFPVVGNVKKAFDFFKAIYDAEDDKKTNTWLDKLNVDDQYSAIVDDTVENAFLKALYQMLSQKPATEVLPINYSVNADLENFLKRRYGNRSVSGRQ